MWSGFDGATATEPHDAPFSSSKIGSMVAPKFVVRQTPPWQVQM
jgi:hypothetical protein